MARKRKLDKAEKLNRAIDLWQRKQEAAEAMLRKSAKMLAKFYRQRRRMLAKATAELPKPAIETDHLSEAKFEEAVLAMDDPNHPDLVAARELLGGINNKDDGIPEVLRRTQKLQAMADPRTKEKKAERREVEKEVRDAELTGKRRKMPLAGKEALAALRQRKMEALGFRKISK
jgi:hypothetical protein